MEKTFEKFDKTILFFIIYTLIFLIFFKTLSYTLPFVLALLFAILLRMPTRFLMLKFKLKSSISSLITTIIFYTIFFLILTLGVTSIASEIISLGESISRYVADQNISITTTFDTLKKYYNDLDPTIINTIENSLPDIQKNLVSILNGIGQGVINFITNLLTSVPYLLMLFVFTLISTYFFTKDISESNNSERLTSHFNSNASKILTVFNESKKMLANYTKSYLIVITVTFVITLIGFLIFGVNYAFVLSLLCAFLDLLPILGITMVYMPVAAVYAINQQYIIAIGLLILYILVSIIRQIVEPKLVSANLGIHPVAVLAAFFIGFKAASVMGMMYCLFLVVFYNILKKVDVI